MITIIVVMLTSAGLVTKEIECQPHEIYAHTANAVNWWEKK